MTFVIGGADRYKTLDQTTISKKNFDQEMQEKGIMSEIKDLSRFNYVLATRCSPRHLEEDHRSLEEKGGPESLKASHAECKKSNLLVTPAPLSKEPAGSSTMDYSSCEKVPFSFQKGSMTKSNSSTYLLPFQRRMNTVSPDHYAAKPQPPRLQICKDNYIIY